MALLSIMAMSLAQQVDAILVMAVQTFMDYEARRTRLVRFTDLAPPRFDTAASSCRTVLLPDDEWKSGFRVDGFMDGFCLRSTDRGLWS